MGGAIHFFEPRLRLDEYMSRTFVLTDWRNPLWERQFHPVTGRMESECSYQAFLIYLALSCHQRSLRAVMADLRRQRGKPVLPPAAGKVRRRRDVSRWLEQTSSRWEWVARVRAYTDEVSRRQHQARLQAFGSPQAGSPAATPTEQPPAPPEDDYSDIAELVKQLAEEEARNPLRELLAGITAPATP